MTRFHATAAIIISAIAAPAAAQLPPVDPLINPDNGHYYQLVRGGGRTFQQAMNEASSSSHLGLPGHLATITSQEEHDFLLASFQGIGAENWIGASDAAINGEWRWIAGPESGQLFWKLISATPPPIFVTGTALGFEAWARESSGLQFEPNDADFSTGQQSREDFATLSFQTVRDPISGVTRRIGAWNDLAGNRTLGYYVEYEPVPEPAGGVLFLLSFAALTAR